VPEKLVPGWPSRDQSRDTTGGIMKLSVLERIMLLQVLPAEGSYSNLKLLREAKESLSFNEEENKALNVKQEDGQIRWDSFMVINKATGEPVEGDPEMVAVMVEKNPELFDHIPTVEDKDFEFGEVVTKLINTALKDLDTNEKLTEQQFSIYEKFVENN